MVRFQSGDIKKHMIKPTVLLNLKMKMIVLIGMLAIAIVGFIGIFLNYFMTNVLETQMGERALSVAQSVAHMPELVEAFKLDDPSSIIQPLVAPIKESTGAEFIVIGNKDEIRYAHPSPESIGKKMIGEDSERALLYGESYVSKATGSLGNSLRAKVPITLDGDIVGIVSVGFLADDILTVIWNYTIELWTVLLLIGAAAIIGAIVIATYIKNLLFGLEPEEISHLLFQKETILHSIHEGIIAVNADGLITMMNSTAQRLLFDDDAASEQFIGKPINTISPTSELPNVLNSGYAQYDQEKIFGNNIVFVNSVPIFFESTLIGAVSTFRNKTEIELLSRKLAHVQQYANALRAQTHEFSNKLYTILGLIHLNKKQEVIDFIQMENGIQQEWIHALIEKVSNPLISGLLLGKLNQASEQHVDLTIQPDSLMTTELAATKNNALRTALGNLIDNAIEAVKEQSPSKRKISIFFTDMGDDVLFEIDDSGPGISTEHTQFIFEQGFSTKEDTHRGFGLALTKQLITAVGGALYIEESELGGTCFVVSIPKNE